MIMGWNHGLKSTLRKMECTREGSPVCECTSVQVSVHKEEAYSVSEGTLGLEMSDNTIVS